MLMCIQEVKVPISPVASSHDIPPSYSLEGSSITPGPMRGGWVGVQLGRTAKGLGSFGFGYLC